MIPPINSRPTHTDLDDVSAEAVDTAMGLLANRQRRAVLRHLERAGGTATLSDVAAAIATETRNPDPATISAHADVSERDMRDVRVSLHHVHVPKLVAADAIDYDSETETLTLLETGRTLLDREEAICGPLR